MYRGTPDPAGGFGISLTGLSPSTALLPRSFRYASACLSQSLPRGARTPVWAPPLSLAATYGIDVSFFSSAYLDVSVQRVPFIRLCIYRMMVMVFMTGFPHSDIGGSPDICSSPPLFAAYHVLLRLSVPRHPPCALFCLTFSLLPLGSNSAARSFCGFKVLKTALFFSSLFYKASNLSVLCFIFFCNGFFSVTCYLIKMSC